MLTSRWRRGARTKGEENSAAVAIAANVGVRGWHGN